jgi:type II secretory pathway pseudopilin PulG
MKNGQTLVETIVVIGIVILLATGLIAGTTASLKSTRTARVKSQSVKLAQEGIERTRGLRDKNWAIFREYAGHYCLDTSGNFVQNVSCPMDISTSDGTFGRGVQFTWNIINERMEVLVSVQYLDGSDPKKTELTTYFTEPALWK